MENHPDVLQHLPKCKRDMLPAIQMLSEQQKFMYETKTHRVDNRIVSISQPWVLPIVRGKQNADVKFGAKIEMSIVVFPAQETFFYYATDILY